MIPKNDIQPSNPRAEPRSSMFLAAVMRAGSEQSPVKIRNMSAHGAMIESAVAPSVGTSVSLMRGTLVVRGTVNWSSGKRCGLHFASEVSVEDWRAAPTQVQQQRVDAMVATVKSGAPDRVPAPVVSFTAPSAEQVAGDMAEIIKLMQDLEDDLASSDDTLKRHGTKLQNLDIAIQMLSAIAGELTPDAGDGAVGNARLDKLRIACTQALGAD